MIAAIMVVDPGTHTILAINDKALEMIGRPRWPHARRLAKAVELLLDPRYDALVTTEIPFIEAPARLPAHFAPGAPGLAAVLRY